MICNRLVKTAIPAVAAALALGLQTQADITVGVTSQAEVQALGIGNADSWEGFMNVSNLPAPDGDGAFQFGSGWGLADLVSDIEGTAGSDVLTLSPNVIGDPDPYWYIGGGAPGSPGNKIMEANLFITESNNPQYSGQNVTFEGTVLANSLTSAHVAEVFIKDFAPDFSSFTETRAPLTPGAFSVTLATDPGADRHVQYGFSVTGVNVWATDVAPFGSVQIATIPEPGTIALTGLGVLALAVYRRRR